MKGHRVAASLFALVLTISSRSSARPKPQPVEAPRFEAAREAVRRGLAAGARGDNEAAVREYRQAHELVPDANIPYRLEAEALVALERYDEAIVAYEKYLAVKPDVSDHDRVRARIEELAARREATVIVASDPTGAAVFVDGSAAPTCNTSCEVLIAPGEHRLVLRLRGRKDALIEVKVEPATRVQVFAPLPSLKTGTDAKGSIESVRSGIGTRRTIGLIAGATGLATLGAAGVMDLSWVSTRIDAFEAARTTPGSYAGAAFDDAQTAQTATIITTIAGATLLAIGATLFFWPPSKAVAR